MVTVVDHPAHMGLLSAGGDLWMPFSDAVKYCVLAVSVLLLLLALGILAWQIFRCYSQSHTTYTEQDIVNSDLMYSDEKPTTAGNYSAPPNIKVEDVSNETRRLSRCLSESSFPSSESSLADKDMRGQETIKKVSGSLRFSVYYDQLQSRLVVTVLQVEGLLVPRQTTSLQPFVKIRLMWTGSEAVEVGGSKELKGDVAPPVLWTVLQEWHTRIVKGSCNPLFGDQFSCVLQDDKDALHHINLRMEVLQHTNICSLTLSKLYLQKQIHPKVRDFDKYSRDTVLGEVRVPLGQLNISYPLELQEDLQIPQKDLVGELLLSLRFLPTSQRLEVGLLKVKMALTETHSDTALYARISIQCNQSKLRYQKTSAMAHSPVTVFNEVFMFSLPEFPLEQCKILVSVYKTHTYNKSSKHLIGQLSVGKERYSEDEHWTLMLLSVRHPIAKWHGLMI